MGRKSRRKGGDGELEVVRILAGAGIDAERNLDQTRDGGADLVFRAHDGVFWIGEVKRVKRVYPYITRKAWDQVTAACEASTLQPRRRVVFYRGDGESWRAMYSVGDYDEDGVVVHSHFENWNRHARNLAHRIAHIKMRVLRSIF